MNFLNDTMSGSPVEESKQIDNKLKSLRKKGQTGVAITRDTVPGTYFEEDPRDDYYEIKQQLAQDPSGFGTTVPVTEKDIKYLQDQKTKEEKFLFDSWKWQTFQPGSDPARIRYYEKIDPQFFADREAEIDKTLDFIQQLGLVVLHGPRSEEDVVLLYGLSSGKVPIPDWKALFPNDFFGQQSLIQRAQPLQQGYWNPNRYVPKDTAPVTLFDTRGKVLSFAGPGAPVSGTDRIGKWKIENAFYGI